MERSRLVALIAALFLVCSLALYVHAADPQDAQATKGTSGRNTVTAANALGAQGGNVTAVNLTSDQTTLKWQGFLGNVSGSLSLGDGTDNFYQWTSASASAVFASPGNSINWTDITNITGVGPLNGKDSDWGFPNTDSDSISNTMNETSCSAGTVIGNAAGVTPLNASSQPGQWTVCIAENSGGAVDDTIFGTDIVTAGGNAYNDETVQYQLMVPVLEAGDQYYFYLEI